MTKSSRDKDTGTTNGTDRTVVERSRGRRAAECTGSLPGPEASRCAWCLSDPLYIAYHDEEWGRPCRDDRSLFEKVVLEGFQAGLSWLTILRKRPEFRRAFADFDAERVARFTPRDVERLLGNAGIVRHRGKIESAINNARRVLELRATHGSLAEFLWRFAPPRRDAPPATLADIPSQTLESKALSRELRRLGWTFVGPTTMYAMMQAVGMVDDHVAGCWRRKEEG